MKLVVAGVAAMAVLIVAVGLYANQPQSVLGSGYQAQAVLLQGSMDSQMQAQLAAVQVSSPVLLLKAENGGMGGFLGPVEAMGSQLKALETSGTKVVFFADGVCTSGCFLLASYADQVWKDPAAVFVFGHAGDYPQVDPILAQNKGWNTLDAPQVSSVTWQQLSSQYQIVGTVSVSG